MNKLNSDIEQYLSEIDALKKDLNDCEKENDNLLNKNKVLNDQIKA